MTTVEVLFRYGMPPGEKEMSALGLVSDVYGIRRVQFNEPAREIRVEYDATRLNEGYRRESAAQSRIRSSRKTGIDLAAFKALFVAYIGHRISYLGA